VCVVLAGVKENPSPQFRMEQDQNKAKQEKKHLKKGPLKPIWLYLMHVPSVAFPRNMRRLTIRSSARLRRRPLLIGGNEGRSFCSKPRRHSGKELELTGREDLKEIFPLSTKLAEKRRDFFRRISSSRGLREETLKAYKIGYGRYRGEDAILFPWIAKPRDFNPEIGKEDYPVLKTNGLQVLRYKLRSLSDKKVMRTFPANGLNGVFGWHLVRPNTETIIITEGEYDAMAVFQATGRVAISVPNGAGSNFEPLMKALDASPQINKVIIWVDCDENGSRCEKKLLDKLQSREDLKVYAIRQKEAKDANEALLNKDFGRDLVLRIISHAIEEIVFRDLEEDENVEDAIVREEHSLSEGRRRAVLSLKAIEEELQYILRNPPPKPPAPQCFPTFNKILGGLRMEEFTVLTGSTGAGKTTFLSQYSMDLAKQGIPTLWGSFEVKKTTLFRKMASQFAFQDDDYPFAIPGNEDFTLEKLPEFCDLPIFIIDRFGASDSGEVFHDIDAAIRMHGVKHIIIDNLQFMVGGGAGLNMNIDSMNYWLFTDKVLGRFRDIASKYDVHVSLVSHPRKEKEGAMLGLDAFQGTGKTTQEADNVIVLQRDGDGHRYVDVKKNRETGLTGRVPLRFHRLSTSFVDAGHVATTLRQQCGLQDFADEDQDENQVATY